MIFILVFILYFSIRFVPYIFNIIPRGYDPGLYVYLWKKYSEVSFFDYDKLENWLIEVYPPLIGVVGKIGSLITSPENLVIPLSIIISIIFFYSIYQYLKIEFDKKTAFWILFLLSTSAIQYKFWWWYYIKNMLAISFIFFYLYFDKKNLKIKHVFTPLIVLTHQPSAIIFFLILLIKKRVKEIVIFVLTFCLYYIPNYERTISIYFKPLISTFASESGTFYGLKEALKLMILYLPLTIYGLYISIKNKINKMWVLMFVVTFLIPLFGLFLSRRFIPFFDLFAIILAGFALSKINNNLFKKVFIFLMIIFSLNFIIKNSAPLINEDEFSEIKNINLANEKSYILITDNAYTPWFYGYQKYTAITPGFGENDIYWNEIEWQKFWSSKDLNKEKELLNKLPRPLYIWTGDKNTISDFEILKSDCVKQYSWHLVEYVCK